MPSRRDVLRGGSLAVAGVVGGVAARYGAWSPSLVDPPDGTWVQPRYGYGNTGHSPDATPPTEEPTLAWTGEVAESVNTLAVGVGRVYAGTEHAVYAFERGDPEDTAAWSRPASGYRLAVGPDVVVAGGRSAVTALDAVSGAKRWAQSGSSVYGLLVDERVAYVGWGNRVDAFALDDGDRAWSLSTSGRPYVMFDGDRLVVSDGRLTAHAPRSDVAGVLGTSPTEAWTSAAVYGTARPVNAGDYTLAGTTTCFRSTDCGLSVVGDHGGHEYHVELGNSAGSVATDGDRAFVGVLRYGDAENGYNVPDDTTLHALDVETGEDLWSFQRPGWFCAPVVAHGTVYVGESGNRYGDGNVYALDAETGETHWTYTGFDGVNDVVAVGDSLVLGTDDGGVAELR